MISFFFMKNFNFKIIIKLNTFFTKTRIINKFIIYMIQTNCRSKDTKNQKKKLNNKDFVKYIYSLNF